MRIKNGARTTTARTRRSTRGTTARARRGTRATAASRGVPAAATGHRATAAQHGGVGTARRVAGLRLDAVRLRVAASGKNQQDAERLDRASGARKDRTLTPHRRVTTSLGYC